MRRWHIMLALAVGAVLISAILTTGGCGGDSPGKTVEDFIDALNNRDFDTVYDISSAGTRESISREEFVAALEANWIEGSRMEGLEITSEEIDGDRAIVKFKVRVTGPAAAGGGEESEQETALVREDGERKLG